MTLFTNILIGLLGLSFLVFFHELGHFIAARCMGVTVEAFSVGMGPVLLHKKRGDTDYRLSLIPLGGYCSMKGEQDYQTALEEKRSEIGGGPDTFYGTHPFRRLIIAFAGPFFNLLFTFFAFSATAMIGYNYYTSGCTVQMSDEIPEYAGTESPAHNAGMKSGDTILSIDGRRMNDFSDIQAYVSLRGGETIIVKVDRDGDELDFEVPVSLDKSTGMGRIGIYVPEESFTKKAYGPYSFFPALAEGFRQTGVRLGQTFRSLGILFKGVDVTNVVSGPARVTTMLGETVHEGFRESARIGVISTLELLAFISLSLFLTNLLPVPVLDGGLILFAIIELVTRRKLNPKLLYYIQMVGIAIVGAIIVLALVGDIRYFIIGSLAK